MKKIKLTQNKFTIVDDEDFDWLNQYKWYALKAPNTYYAVRNFTVLKNKRKKIYVHRLILEKNIKRKLEVWECIDHINDNGLDNRKLNLRICNNQQNQFNSRKQKNTTSKYKGVLWHNRDKKWMSYIYYNNKSKYLGYYSSEVEAAKIYDKTAKELFGEFARLNFEE